jgi:UDP-glucuronate 4-epimerase
MLNTHQLGEGADMKVFIFGGKGFIGKVLEHRAGQLHEVAVLDLNDVDIRNPNTYTDQLVREKPDVVINLGAVLGTMKHSPTTCELFETNVIGNLNVLYATRAAGVKNYVFTSSMTVHGGNDIGKHQTRFSPFGPKHGYSFSKAAAEYSMMQFAKESPEMKIVTVRPTMVLGKGTYLPHAPIEFIKAIYSGQDIELYGEGRHEREWVWIDDVADGIIKASEFALKSQPGYQPFFLGGNRISMRDLADKVATRLRGKVRITPSTSQAFTLTADPSDSQKMLGWEPRFDMDRMIELLVDILGDEMKVPAEARRA